MAYDPLEPPEAVGQVEGLIQVEPHLRVWRTERDRDWWQSVPDGSGVDLGIRPVRGVRRRSARIS